MVEYSHFDPEGDLATAIVDAVRAGESYDCGNAEVPADWLRDLITGSIEPNIHSKGVRLSNARITGQLDLEAVTIDHGVRLEQCQFDNAMNLVGAHLRELHLNGSLLPGITAGALRLDQDMWLVNATVIGTVAINSATITGQLVARQATLNGNGQQAVLAQQATLTGGIILDNATVTGTIDIHSATITGQFAARQATLNGNGEESVQARGAEIGGGIFLDDAIVTGTIGIHSATISGQFVARKATLDGNGKKTLQARRAVVTGDIFLTNTIVTGTIGIHSATISGQFAARQATLNGNGKKAVWAQGAEIGGGIFLTNATVTGTIDINSTTVSGQFAARQATLNGNDKKAVLAQRASITGGIFLTNATVTGTIDINNATVSGQFAAKEARLNGNGQEAVKARRVVITGDIIFDRSTVTGTIDIYDSTASILDVRGATLESTTSALVAAHASLGRLVWLPSHVEGVVDVRDVTGGTWELSPDSVCTGSDQWQVTGFTYERIESLGTSWGIKSRIRWLDAAQDDRSPGPYEQMAAVYRHEGHNAPARQVLIAGNKQLEQGFPGWIRRILFGWTIGYGYQPWRVLLYLFPIFLGLAIFAAMAPDGTDDAWLVASSAGENTAAGNEGDGHGASFQPFVYALDTILPVIDFGQADQWTVDRNPDWAWTLAILVWVAIGAGWLFGILLVAAASGLVRQT